MNTSKNIHTYATATALAIVIGGTGFWYLTRPPAGDDPVFSRKVLDYHEIPAGEGEPIIKYSFLGERLPERLEKNEIPELRTKSSYVVEVEAPTKDTRTFEGRFFSQEAFVQENGAWYYKESATTTTTAFNAFKERALFADFFIPRAYAYTANPFVGNADGFVAHANSTSWATIHDATAGVSAAPGGTDFIVGVFLDTSGNYSIYRAFLPFDTSSIPSSASISSASLTVKAQSVAVTDNDAQAYLTVVQTSQATHTTLTTADYDTCGAVSNPTEGIASGDRKTLATLPIDTYASFTLNSTGRGWIKKNGDSSSCSSTTGITCLGIREGHDTTNNAINVANDTDGNFVSFFSSEETGTTDDPYLSITYSLEPGSYEIVENFANLGYQEWVAPATVTSAYVECWGAGGGGGDGNATGGGGGGGGAYAASTVSVTPLTAYPVFVGTGGFGASQSSSAAGTSGTDSSFATTTVVADGGVGGGGGTGAPAGGTGGSTANSTGDVEFAGGAGGAGETTGDTGGGGGGSAGPDGAGGAGANGTGTVGGGGGGGNGGDPGSGQIGGASTQGGAGGSGVSSSNGSVGSNDVNGGGGGGGGDDARAGGAGGFYGAGGGGGENAGANGGNGACRITYDLVVPSPFSFWQWMDF